MQGDRQRRRVLLLAGLLEESILSEKLAPLFQEQGWEFLKAENIERAQFALHYFGCDVLLVDEGFFRRAGTEAVAWLAAQRAAPVMLMTDWDAELVTAALTRGAQYWVPRTQVLCEPRSLLVFLERAAAGSDLRKELDRVGEACAARQRQVKELMEKLAGLLPLGHRTWWLPREGIVGRLTEELERARRYRTPLAAVMGQVVLGADGPHPWPAGPPLGKWVAEQLDQGKRLTDVGGDLGPGRFLLLLSHTLRSGAVACCQRLKADLEDRATEHQPRLRAAFGIACSPKGAQTPEQLLTRVEKCLARARRGEQSGVVAV